MKGEIIGKEMEVIESGNEDLVGVHGKVVDETKNTLEVETEEGMKTVLKEGSTFRIDGNIVKGGRIAVRPEDRVRL